MSGLEAEQVLRVCERARGLPPHRQAQLVLEAACANETPQALAALPVGRRDARLLRVRAQTLGPVIEIQTRCPSCAERLDLDLDTDDFLADPRGPSEDEVGPLTVTSGGHEVVVRMPTGRDLEDVASAGAGVHALLLRCVLSAAREGTPVPPGELPAEVAAEVQRCLAAADPLADILLALTCPACDHAWSEPFDPASFLWWELEARAPALYREVHTLASAYGWSERDILRMGAWRRAHYLALLDA